MFEMLLLVQDHTIWATLFFWLDLLTSQIKVKAKLVKLKGKLSCQYPVSSSLPQRKQFYTG